MCIRDRNITPIPSPALKSIAIQLIKLNSGVALVPPSLIFPKRLIAMHIQKIRNPFAHKMISHPKLLAINDCVLLKTMLAASRFTSVIPTKVEITNIDIKNLL